jgi:very-short-patch-repair endonuclease
MRQRSRTKLDEAKPRLRVHNDVAYRTKVAARDLRSRETESEAMLWEALRSRRFLGLKFRRQHAIGPFIVDFWCAEQRLVVEVDGAVHDDPEQRRSDESRQAVLESISIRVVRVTNRQIAADLHAALQTIAQAVHARTE